MTSTLMQLGIAKPWQKGKWPKARLTNADFLKELKGCLWEDYDLEAGEFTVAGKPIIITHTGKTDVTFHGNTGDTTWCAAYVLAKYLEHMWPSLVRTIESQDMAIRLPRVLEIGSGSGVAGLSAAALGASSVILSDLEYCHESLQESIKLSMKAWNATPSSNSKGCENIEVVNLDWFKAEQIPQTKVVNSWLDCDIILGAGVFWLNHLLIPCVRTLESLSMCNPDAVIIIAYQTRCEHYDDDMFDALHRSFDCFVIPRSAQHPEFNLDCIHLMTLKRKVNAPDDLHPFPPEGSHLLN